MKYIACLLFVVGLFLIIFARIDGVDMTEGQLFLNYLPFWLLSFGCLVGGYAILNNLKK